MEVDWRNRAASPPESFFLSPSLNTETFAKLIMLTKIVCVHISLPTFPAAIFITWSGEQNT